jgi:hypothetical protein
MNEEIKEVKLVRYENARQAMAELYRVDEVKEIRDKAVAAQEYAKQAKDTELIKYATEVRLRAERRAGELLIEMRPDRNSGHEGVTSKKPKQSTIISEKKESFETTPLNQKQQNAISVKPKLADLGVNKDQSSKWQKLAAMPEDLFEEHIEIEKQKFDSRIKKDEEKTTNQKTREEKRRLKAEEQLRKNEEKRRLKEEEELYHQKIDKSDFPQEIKEMLKGQKLKPHLNSFAFDFINHLGKDEEKLEAIMDAMEQLNHYQRHMLAATLYKIGNYYINCAEKLKRKEQTPKSIKMITINPND